MLAILAAAPLAARPSFAASDAVSDLAGKLADPAADVRLDAAERLLNANTPESRKALSDALYNADENPRLAAARALGEAENPDAALIEPLFVALNTNRQQTAEAVTRALARYSDNGDVLTRIMAVATRVPANPTSRREILRVLGSFVDKRSAALLMQVYLDPFESQASKSAAADALADMTATPASGSPDWALWWKQHQGQKESDFRAGLLALRSQQVDLLKLRDNQMAGELTGMLRDQYNAFGPAQQTEVLLRYLKSQEPAIRALGTNIAAEQARLGQNVVNAVRDQLRLMISDRDADVRAGAATALAKINDPTALTQILAQLTQEPSPKARVALARALGVIDDPAAVQRLLELLGDNSLMVVTASASALDDQLRSKNPADNPRLASDAAEALQTAFGKLQPSPSNEEARQALLRPMVPLKQDKLVPLLKELLAQQRGESAGIRRLALQAIGEIGNATVVGSIASLLDDPDRSIRLAAVRALGNNPAAAGSAVQLMQRCDPQIESDPAVQGEAWNVVASLLQTLSVEQLQSFTGRLSTQPEHRLQVLNEMARQLFAQNDPRKLSDLAGVQENIGNTLMELNRPKDAAQYFRSAFDFRQSQKANEAVQGQLAGEYMNALLRARLFKEAIVFANDIDKDPQYIGVMGRLIIDQLRTFTQAAPPELDNAKLLIVETRKMSPPLGSGLKDSLSDIEREVDRQIAAKGGGPSGANPPETKTPAVSGSVTASR